MCEARMFLGPMSEVEGVRVETGVGVGVKPIKSHLLV